MPLVSFNDFTQQKLKSPNFLSLLSHDDNADLRLHTTNYNEFAELRFILSELYNGNMFFPQFNQQITWDKSHMDSFMEAVPLDMPTPPITLVSDKRNELFIVIDGYQRLMTLALFSQNLSSRYENEMNQSLLGFRLDTLSPNSKWHGLSYKDLSGIDATKFEEYSISQSIVCFDDSETFDYAYYMYHKLSSSSYFKC